jgi:hypothetical protein
MRESQRYNILATCRDNINISKALINELLCKEHREHVFTYSTKPAVLIGWSDAVENMPSSNPALLPKKVTRATPPLVPDYATPSGKKKRYASLEMSSPTGNRLLSC